MKRYQFSFEYNVFDFYSKHEKVSTHSLNRQMDQSEVMNVYSLVSRIFKAKLGIYHEVFYSAYKKRRDTGLPSVNLNVYWPDIGNLVYVLAFHWSFVLYDVNFIGTLKSFVYL